jgi:hypothetical protein
MEFPPVTQALQYLPVLLASPQQLDKLSLRDEPLFVPGGDDPKPQLGPDERPDSPDDDKKPDRNRSRDREQQ